MPGGAVRIAVDPNGVPWVINDSNNIYRWNGNDWDLMPGNATDIGIGSDGSVWITGINSVGGGFNIATWYGDHWIDFPGGALRISVGPDGVPWVINDANSIYRFDFNGNVWNILPGQATDIGVGPKGLAWIIGTQVVNGGHDILWWNGIAWNLFEGGATGIAAGTNNNPWVVNNIQDIFGWIGELNSQAGTYTLVKNNIPRINQQICVRLKSDTDGVIGIMFRCADSNNYYRFSMSRYGNYYRLIKKVGGILTVVWEKQISYIKGQFYKLSIRTIGKWIEVYLDGTLIFERADADLKGEKIALYCYNNAGAHFDNFAVTNLERRVGEWVILDEGRVNSPSQWKIKDGVLYQTSKIGGGAPDFPGTMLLKNDLNIGNCRYIIKVRSDSDNSIGMIFRYVDEDNFYRFSVSDFDKYRRLSKKEKGVYKILWQDTTGFKVGESFVLRIDAIGSKLVGYMDDDLLFEEIDTDYASGMVGLYCSDNPGAHFEQIEVLKLPAEVSAILQDRFPYNDISGWSPIDAGNVNAPSDWKIEGGILKQVSDIHTADTGIGKYGTHFIKGNVGWRDIILNVKLESDSGAIGVLFRYRDENNYYRFSMDAGYRRLVKNVGECLLLCGKILILISHL
ncbi:MAG: hypothetical protein ABIN89_27125 [Chitinophagaceae bacterium]